MYMKRRKSATRKEEDIRDDNEVGTFITGTKAYAYNPNVN